MKTTFKFIIAAMAAISVFSSCQKELANESVSNTTDGVRTISVQFDNSTKASLSGFTPSFTNGDKIRVSNTEKSEECTVTVGGTVTFTTTLSGALTAIYPAAAAVYTSGTPDGPISSPYFKVSASQDGDIAKAIIAKAIVEAESSSATFNVQTALFEITPPSGATSFTITSLKPVVDGVARTGTAKPINTDGQDDDGKCVITVSNSDSTTFYVALVHGVNLSDLSFEYTTDATHGAMKGITKNAITAAGGTDQTAANTKYTINKENWHPYVTIGVKKWATENIGATNTNPYGTYFAWAETKGHALKESSVGVTGTIATAFVGDYNFSWANCPYQKNTSSASSTKYTKYLGSTTSSYKHDTATDADAIKTVLDLVDDAAYVNWGGSWRMPTNAEFEVLVSKKRGDFSSGYNFGESDTQQIFLPAAGYGDGTDLYFAGDSGSYWSSSLFTGNPDFAYCLYFDVVDPSSNFFGRLLGLSVRALSE